MLEMAELRHQQRAYMNSHLYKWIVQDHSIEIYVHGSQQVISTAVRRWSQMNKMILV